MPDVISNTSPLLYLHRLGLIRLLPEIYGKVLVPVAVVVELEAGRDIGIEVPDPRSLDWVDVRSLETQPLLALDDDLGAGERELFGLAVSVPDALVILDDAQARIHAVRLGIPHTGTLGVLLRAKREGRISLVAPLLDQLTTAGFRVGSETSTAVLKLAGES